MMSVAEFAAENARTEWRYGGLVLIVALALYIIASAARWRPLAALLARIPAWRPNLSGVPVLLIVGIGLMLRLPRLWDVAWYDEAFAARMASLPLGSLPTAILGDVHPPGYYALQWVQARLLGNSVLVLRLPALIAGVACIYLAYRLARRLTQSGNAAVFAALIVALMPASIWYGDEGRCYSLLAALVLLALIGVLEARPALLAGALAGLPLLHNIGYLYAAVIGLAALAYDRRNLAFMALAAVPGALWLPAMLYQSSHIAAGFWIPTLTPPGVLLPIAADTLALGIHSGYLLLPMVAALVLTMLAVLRWRLYASHAWLACLAVAIGVPVLLALASWAWRPVYLPRALLPVGMLIAVGWARLLSRPGRLALALNVMTWPILLFTVGVYFIVPYEKAIDYPTTLARCAGADNVLYMDVAAQFIGALYSPTPGYLWPGANDLNQALSPSAKAAFGFMSADAGDLAGRLCIVAQDNPLVSAAERAELGRVLAAYPQAAPPFMAARNSNERLAVYQVIIP